MQIAELISIITYQLSYTTYDLQQCKKKVTKAICHFMSAKSYSVLTSYYSTCHSSKCNE